MEAKEARRPLVRRHNPELTVEDSAATTQKALLERLASLTDYDRISELKAMSDLLFSQVTELTQVPDLSDEAQMALSGLGLSLSKRTTRLESARIHGRY
jgi:hypothetical protein